MTVTIPTLSYREWQIFSLLAQGVQNKEIARQLALSVNTVEKHLTHIYKKLAVKNRAGAGQWYWDHRQYWKNNGNP
jgi:DNA-binding NarL/FixJ family response regulator